MRATGTGFALNRVACPDQVEIRTHERRLARLSPLARRLKRLGLLKDAALGEQTAMKYVFRSGERFSTACQASSPGVNSTFMQIKTTTADQ